MMRINPQSCLLMELSELEATNVQNAKDILVASTHLFLYFLILGRDMEGYSMPTILHF